MWNRIVKTALEQRIVVIVLAAIALAFGVDATRKLSVDAFPDVTNVQVQIATEVPGRSPEEVERIVTVPVEIGMTGLPGLTELRSLNKPGLSIITLVFTDATPIYFARQLVSERLSDVRSRLPEGITPILGPVSTALSEVYQYTIESTKDGQRALSKQELIDRRIIQDWVARPLLRSIPGVAEINSTGGFVKQYQVHVDPIKMRYYGLTIHNVHEALARNNANSSGGILPRGPEVFLVRGVGLIKSLDDIRAIVLKEERSTPVTIGDVAEVKIGEEVRYGAMIKGGYTESVGGIVLMVAGGNAKDIVSKIKTRVDEINNNNMLPDGLKIVPYYDRSELVDAALATVSRVLVEGIVFVVIILFLFLGDLRSSLIVIATLVLTPALTFVVMNYINLSANLMSLGGLAIAIGLMIDGSVVVVENVYARLGQYPNTNRLKVVSEAVFEVASPVVFGICIIILVFLPLMTLEDMEGKMFAPLAITIAIALGISLLISLTISPVLSLFLLKGGGEHETWVVRMLKRPYVAMLRWTTANQKTTVVASLALFIACVSLFPYLGTSFIPEMKEGVISPNADRAPNISLEESIKMEFASQNLVKDLKGVKGVVSRLGRGESPVDPAGFNENDMMIQLTPIPERPGLTQDSIADVVRKRITSLPGLNVVMAQPISDRQGRQQSPRHRRRQGRSRPRPAEPHRHHRSSGHRPSRPQCLRRQRRHRGRRRWSLRHRDLRRRAPLPGRRPLSGSPPPQHRRHPQHPAHGSGRGRSLPRQSRPHRDARGRFSGPPRDEQAPPRRRRQRQRSRPRQLRRRAPATRQAGSLPPLRLLPRVGRPVPEHGTRAPPPHLHRPHHHWRHLLPALLAVPLLAPRFAHHPRAALCFNRRHRRPLLHGRISLRARQRRLHRALGHRRAQWRRAGLLHPQSARGRHGPR